MIFSWNPHGYRTSKQSVIVKQACLSAGEQKVDFFILSSPENLQRRFRQPKPEIYTMMSVKGQSVIF